MGFLLLVLLVVCILVLPFTGGLILWDYVRDRRRRKKEPSCEAQVRQRIDTHDLQVAVPLNEETHSLEPEGVPIYRQQKAVALFGLWGIAVVLSLIFLDESAWAWVVVPAIITGYLVFHFAIFYQPSLTTRVRYQLRVADAAKTHHFEYVALSHPGEGWDLGKLGDQLAGRIKPWKLTDGSLLKKPANIVLRAVSGPRFEFGDTRHLDGKEKHIECGYFLAEIPPVPCVCLGRVPRRLFTPSTWLNRSGASGFNRAYVVRPGCEEVSSCLSTRTRELIADLHCDVIVMYGTWMLMWWEEPGGLVPDRLDWPQDKAWKRVEKVRGLLASLGRDFAWYRSG